MAFHPQTLTYIYHAYHISNLAYIYHASHIKSYPRQQTNEHISSRQEHRHGIKQACDRCLSIQPSMFILIIKVTPYACPYECMTYFTYLTTPQHLCINAWSCYMHVHDISKKTLKRNPNLACEQQTSNKTWRQRLIRIKLDQDRCILNK